MQSRNYETVNHRSLLPCTSGSLRNRSVRCTDESRISILLQAGRVFARLTAIHRGLFRQSPVKLIDVHVSCSVYYLQPSYPTPSVPYGLLCKITDSLQTIAIPALNFAFDQVHDLELFSFLYNEDVCFQRSRRRTI